MLAGLLAVPVPTHSAKNTAPNAESVIDPRVVRLKQFFAERDCPLGEYAADLIKAADRNDLDWRLLPSISFIESGGGKYYMNNNVFGWNSCKERFTSVRDGIHYVASRLGNSELYKEKTLDEKLKMYNPHRRYAKQVQQVMRTIAITDPRLLTVD